MVMNIAVRLGDCPPSDKGVGCKHGTYSQPVVDLGNDFLPTRSVASSTVHWWWSVIKDSNEYPRPEIALILSYLLHFFVLFGTSLPMPCTSKSQVLIFLANLFSTAEHVASSGH
jgi:hypothetical protein